MKPETPDLVKAALKPLGFVHEDDYEYINDPNCKRDFGDLGEVVVWGRHWSKVSVNWLSDYEDDCIQIIETEDVDLLVRSVNDLLEYIERLAVLRKLAKAEPLTAPSTTPDPATCEPSTSGETQKQPVASHSADSANSNSLR